MTTFISNITFSEHKQAVKKVGDLKRSYSLLFQNLYLIKEKISPVKNSYIYKIELIQGCKIFEVHFPTEPIVPGSCLVDMGKELIESFVGKPLEIIELANVRYYHAVSPIETPELDFCFKFKDSDQVEPGKYRMALTIKKGETTFAKMMFCFQ